MLNKGWLFGIAVALVGNLIVFVGVARNRSGEPDARIELTERELPIGYQSDENSGISLRLETNYEASEDWLDRAKLEQIGFDCSAPVTSKTRSRYDKQLPIEAFVVLEYEGEAWSAWLEKQQKQIDDLAGRVERGEALAESVENAREALDRSRRTASRLFPIDAGTDPRGLRRRYDDRSRHLIVPAVFRIWVNVQKAEVYGRVSTLLVDQIHVSRAYREIFDRLPRRQAWEVDPEFWPRYAVTLELGSRHEPWIAAARTTEAPRDGKTVGEMRRREPETESKTDPERETETPPEQGR